jgi:HK97 family phage major capsid protein
MNSPELKAAIDELGRNFAAFQQANDRRYDELKRGVDDVVSKTVVEQLNAQVTESQKKVDDLGITVTSRVDSLEAMVNRMKVGAGGGDRVEAAKAAATFFSVAERRPVPLADAEARLDQYSAYCDAFLSYTRANGNVARLSMDVQAALSVGSSPDGGYFVPAETSSAIATRMFETSPMRQLATVITIGTDRWSQPKDVNDATSGGWVGEQQTRSATATPEIGEQEILTHEQYAYPEITQKMLEDSVIDIRAWLENKTADKLVRTENAAFVTGNGVMKPKGFLGYGLTSVTTADATRAWGLLQYVPMGASGAFPTVSGSTSDDASKLIDLMAALNPAYRQGANWAMARSTEATVRKLRDADGRYLVGFGSLSDGAFGFSLHGYPIVNLEDMPVIAANSFSIAFGNFRTGYLIVDRIGMNLLVDPYTNKPKVGLYMRKRVGGDVVNFDAIKLGKFAAS